MQFRLIKFILACTILLQISCNDCYKADCVRTLDVVKIKWIKDGKNVLFGPDATFDRDSVRLYISDLQDHDYNISYNEITQTMDLGLLAGPKYILNFKNIRTDTFVVTNIVISMTDCCKQYKLSNATMNGQIICQDGCDDIIEIQL